MRGTDQVREGGETALLNRILSIEHLLTGIILGRGLDQLRIVFCWK
jgi:hypothetical protein